MENRDIQANLVMRRFSITIFFASAGKEAVWKQKYQDGRSNEKSKINYGRVQLPVQTALKRYSLNLVNQDVRFKTSKLGEKAGVVGACYIVRDRFFGLI